MILIVACAIFASCGFVRHTIEYAKRDYNDWKQEKRRDAISNHELPPADQYLFCVDTIQLKNPVIVSDNYNRWIIDAPERPLNDEIIKSYLADSVKYIYPWGYTFLSSDYSEDAEEFRRQWKVFSESGDYYTRDHTEILSSKKYVVYSFDDSTEGFVLFLINARFYAKLTTAIDVESRIDHMVTDYTNCYVPILRCLKPFDEKKQTQKKTNPDDL